MTRKFTLLFILLNLLLSGLYLDTWQNANTVSRALPVLAFSDSGTLAIDKYKERTIDKSVIGEHYYSDKAPLPTFIVIPVHSVLTLTGSLNTQNGYDAAIRQVLLLGDILCSVIPFLLILLFTVRYALLINNSSQTLILTMFVFYGSFLFIYTGTFFSHIISGMFLLLSYTTLKFHRNYFLSGIFAGCAFLSEYTIGIVFILWPLQTWLKERSVRGGSVFLLGVLPSLIFLLIYNHMITGSMFDLLYNHEAHPDFAAVNKILGFSYPSITALMHLLFTPYRSIFLYMPVLLLLLGVVIRFRNVIREKLVTRNFLLPLVLIYVLIISAHHMWWGGWCYGPRQLAPIVVLLGFETVRMLSKYPVSVYFTAPLAALGLIITWMAKVTTSYSIPTEINDPFGEVFSNFSKGNFNGNNLLTEKTGMSPVLVSVLWLCLFLVSVLLIHFLFRKKELNPGTAK